MKRANQIFISYRREDTAGVTGRLYDRLVQHYGRNAVFKDVDSIPLGSNFKQYIDSVIKNCDLVIVVIGDRWLGSEGETRRRIDDPRDLVRIEVESALQRAIPVVPLLVQNTPMPGEADLPRSLQELAYRNGMSIRHDPHFHADVDLLIKNMETLASTPSRTTSASNPIPSSARPQQQVPARKVVEVRPPVRPVAPPAPRPQQLKSTDPAPDRFTFLHCLPLAVIVIIVFFVMLVFALLAVSGSLK
jgi:hypothetical protein